ncbi:MAG: hypothetical protein HWN68_19180, partial [Desulfobacterales bacterium]|nr:hypothetical protein [Desulfobacterales bacterium]
MSVLIAPSASDPTVFLADWFELKALSSDDRNSSREDFVCAIQIAGTVEDITGYVEEDEIDEESLLVELEESTGEKIEAVADAVFEEMGDRYDSCGNLYNSYPFSLHQNFIQIISEPEESVYFFLLLLSFFGRHAGPKGTDGARLFELLAMEAATAYFGGAGASVQNYHFGWPRPSTPTNFRNAINDMCGRIGEGKGCRIDRPTSGDMKDAKLDLAVWLPFSDEREGKLIAFGQGTTAKKWADKLTELQPEPFCSMWLLDNPAVCPVRLFFVPHRIERDQWLYAARLGGIVFDRCRLTSHSRTVSDELLEKCADW